MSYNSKWHFSSCTLLTRLNASSLVVEGFYVEKIGIEINLISLDAEFSAEQHKLFEIL